jgi:hypothetical protein
MTTLTMRTPADLVSAVPYIMGFTPSDSIVMMALGGRQLHARLDLPDSELDLNEALGALMRPAVQHGNDTLILVSYTEEDEMAEAVSDKGRTLANVYGLTLVQSIQVDPQGDHRIAVPGAPWVETGSSHVAAQMVVEGGRAPRKSRQELVESIKAGDNTLDTIALEAAKVEVLTVGLPDGFMTEIMERSLTGEDVTDEEWCLYTAGLHITATYREEVFTAIKRVNARHHCEALTRLLVRTPEGWGGPAAGLLALAAWLAGDGALSWVAIDRSRVDSPNYPLAELMDQILTMAVHPDTWETR